MAWRIMISWDFVSPVLRTATGTINLEQFRDGMAVMPPTIKHTWSLSIKDGQLGQKGFIPDLTEEVKDIIHCMMVSYFDGVNLSESSCEWIYPGEIYERSEEDWIIDYMI